MMFKQMNTKIVVVLFIAMKYKYAVGKKTKVAL